MSVKRPVLRYHGGKWKLAPWVIANMPKHRTYIEPFGGGRKRPDAQAPQ